MIDDVQVVTVTGAGLPACTASPARDDIPRNSCSAPIGIFDSGIGGLSVLRHIRAQLPCEELLYFADSGFAPYGDKPESAIIARSLAVTDFFVQSRAKALVVACNTATAAAIKFIRERHPALTVVGVEPGLKPAATLTSTGTVGVLATRGTLASSKFTALRDRLSAETNVRFLAQACSGLADQIEKGELQSPATTLLVRRYVEPLLEQGADTLVLGCTHYPFVRQLIEEIATRISSRPVSIIDTGEPVARQLTRLLTERKLLNGSTDPGSIQAFTTGSETALASAFSRLLHLQPEIHRLAVAA
ncbi:glutamate racemase [Noviherbaspirillum massiliense]|uniref:glutamate racemase n=1 Tax=Noviherbaspirillum massiliense TaxID=1465823 RepID=UPI00030BC1F9